MFLSIAAEHFIKGLETSDENPNYEKILNYKLLIREYIVYLRRDSFSGYFYIAFLPQGDIGYDNHSYEVINDLEDVKNALNEIISQRDK